MSDKPSDNPEERTGKLEEQSGGAGKEEGWLVRRTWQSRSQRVHRCDRMGGGYADSQAGGAARDGGIADGGDEEAGLLKGGGGGEGGFVRT